MIKALKSISWRNVLYGMLWLISLLGLGILLSFISVKSKQYACNDLQIIIPGEQSFIAREDVDRILKEKHGELIGKTLSSIPIHTIEHELKAIPFVEEALVNVDMNGKLIIRVKQREAVVRVINERGDDFYVDKQGLKMPLSPYYAPLVLVANGRISERFNNPLDSMETTVLKDLYKTAEFIQADTLWNNQIEQLYVNTQGDIEMVPRIGKQKIVLGNADFLTQKFEKLLLFYKQIIPAVGWQVYQKVDLSFTNQLVCEKNENYTPNSNKIQ